MTNARGLLADEIPPPDKQLLLDWLAAHDVYVSDYVEIETSDLGGWGVRAKRDMGPDHLRTWYRCLLLLTSEEEI